jgi:BioD-like phosphotransacetylase family protein
VNIVQLKMKTTTLARRLTGSAGTANQGIYVMGTSVDVGKTACSLGIVSGLQKRVGKVGYLKPVGGYSNDSLVELAGGGAVDRDAVLMSDHFKMEGGATGLQSMSPVVTPPGFFKQQQLEQPAFKARAALERSTLERITRAHAECSAGSDFTVIEGTGHAAMGSVMRLTNSRIASELGMDAVLVAGGRDQRLSATVDDIALNRQMCLAHGVNMRGVIVNRVRPEDVEDVRKYLPEALGFWGLSLLGIVPDHPSLVQPCMHDFETLFGAQMVTGRAAGGQAFEDVGLVASSLEHFGSRRDDLVAKEQAAAGGGARKPTLLVTHHSRADVIQIAIEAADERARQGGGTVHGLIVTGCSQGDQLPAETRAALEERGIPCLELPLHALEVSAMVAQCQPQLSCEPGLGGTGSGSRADAARDLVEANVDFDQLLMPVFREGIGRF